MSENPEPPQPDPALRRLDRLVGRWTMEGNLVDSDAKNIRGESTFRWLPGGFFLEQRARIDFMGQQIDALELIGYDPETDTFPSTPAPRREDGTFSGGWRANPGADETVNVPSTSAGTASSNSTIRAIRERGCGRASKSTAEQVGMHRTAAGG